MIFHGPLQEAAGYFASIGFPLPNHCNPADFYLDVAAGVFQSADFKQSFNCNSLGIVPCKSDPNFEWPKLFDLWESHRQAGLKENERQLSRYSYCAFYSVSF